MMIDRARSIEAVFETLRRQGVSAAREHLLSEYPFVRVDTAGRHFTEFEAVQLFMRDGFIDRYSGQKLIFPGVLRILHRLLPEEFPFQRNWRMTDTHDAYWRLFPTVDHVIPVARGGLNDDSNWVTTSMLRNSAKANWTVEQLGWSVLPPGRWEDWDGLTRDFLEYVGADDASLEDVYLRRWRAAAARVLGTQPRAPKLQLQREASGVTTYETPPERRLDGS